MKQQRKRHGAHHAGKKQVFVAAGIPPIVISTANDSIGTFTRLVARINLKIWDFKCNQLLLEYLQFSQWKRIYFILENRLPWAALLLLFTMPSKTWNKLLITLPDYFSVNQGNLIPDSLSQQVVINDLQLEVQVQYCSIDYVARQFTYCGLIMDMS